MIQTIAATAVGGFLYMILITYASVTAQEVASEKGTKIMEVVFSSIRASHYFYARMLALLLVILTHIGIYVVGGLAAILLFKDYQSCTIWYFKPYRRGFLAQHLIVCLG